MENDFNRWFEYAEWRGQTVQALKDITSELKELKMELEKTKDALKEDISEIRNDNKRRDIKTAEIAGGTSVIILIIGLIVSALL